MRKSVREKIEIAKKASSDKLIKKLAIQHGITTKTIRSWVELYKKGSLSEPVKRNKKVYLVKLKGKTGIFSEAVFKATAVYSVLEGRTVYRYLFKDIAGGIFLCAYSDDNSVKRSEKILTTIISLLNGSGIFTGRILTDVKFTDKFKSKIKEADITQVKNTEIKRYIAFSSKSNSFMKERTRYEKENDFLFDSCATTAKNNDILFQKLPVNNKELIEAVKKVTIILHSTILSDTGQEYNELRSKEIINERFNYALEFHKKYDLETARLHYSEIIQVVCPSYDRELYIRVTNQIGKIYGLRKEPLKAVEYFKASLKEAEYLSLERKPHVKYSIYVILADLYRIMNNYKKVMFFMKKAEIMLEAGCSDEDRAAFYINYSILLKTRKNYEIKMDYIKKAIDIAEKNNLKYIKVAAEDILTDYYVKRGDYGIALDRYRGMIENDIYKDNNFALQKIILHSKYSDCLQYSGDLSESLKMYDRVKDLIAKLEDNPAFRQYMIIARGNRSILLSKMNEDGQAIEDFKVNIEYARKHDFKNNLIDNMLNLCYAFILSGRIEEAEKTLKETSLMLEHSENHSHKHAEILYDGMIWKLKGNLDKAENKLTKSLNYVKKIPTLVSGYFKVLTETAELYILSGKYKEAASVIKGLRNKARIKNNGFYLFRSELLTVKLRFIQNGQKKNYSAYLKERHEKGKYENEEQKYFLLREIKTL